MEPHDAFDPTLLHDRDDSAGLLDRGAESGRPAASPGLEHEYELADEAGTWSGRCYCPSAQRFWACIT